MSAKIKTACLGDKAMTYAVFGEGKKKKNLVILPGLSVGSVTPAALAVEKQFSLFCEDYTVYLCDRPVGAKTLRQMAEDTAALLLSEGVAKAMIYGTSQGGMIAQFIAAAHPDRVEKLALASTCGESTDTLIETVDGWRRLALAGDTLALAAAFGEYLYSPATFAANRASLLAAADTYTQENLDWFCRGVEALHLPPFWEETDKIAAAGIPTVVLGSEGDRVFGRDAVPALARRLGCPLVLYGEEYGHAVYDEAPDFVAKLFAFCQGEA